MCSLKRKKVGDAPGPKRAILAKVLDERFSALRFSQRNP
jgi:hypothetical protein